jgi:hypothetical protein
LIDQTKHNTDNKINKLVTVFANRSRHASGEVSIGVESPATNKYQELFKLDTPRNINQISNLPDPQRAQHGGKNRAIPAGRFYRGFYSSHGVMRDSRQVTLTNLIAGPLGTMPGALHNG